MLSESQIAANRKSASNLAREKIGLPNINVNQMTYEQRIAYNKALAEYILRYPNAFAPIDIQNAQAVSNATYSTLEDPSFDFVDFASETASNAAAPLQAVGDGIISTAKAARWVIPLVAVVVVVILVSALNNKVKAS